MAPGTSQDPADRDGTASSTASTPSPGTATGRRWPRSKAFGDDLVFLPAPDFGNGPKIGAASWQFGVSAKSPNQEGANAFIEFALQDKYLAAFSDGIGPDPGDGDGGRDDRELQGRRPDGGLLRPQPRRRRWSVR